MSGSRTRNGLPAIVPKGFQCAHDLPVSWAQIFICEWCLKTREKVRVKEEAAKEADTVEIFARRWYSEIVEPANSSPRNIKRVLEKDVIPAIGGKQIADVTVTDILAITDKIKNRGALSGCAVVQPGSSFPWLEGKRSILQAQPAFP